jgi:chromate transporter
LALIRGEFVERRGWVTEDEFARYWALVQAAPGINLLALTILIGRKTGGAVGVGLALLGLLAPSVPITILLTAGYEHIRDVRWVHSAVRGIVPATVGVGICIMSQMALPVLRAARARGAFAFGIAVTTVIVSAGIVLVQPRAVVVVLLAAGLTGAAAAIREPVAGGDA